MTTSTSISVKPAGGEPPSPSGHHAPIIIRRFRCGPTCADPPRHRLSRSVSRTLHLFARVVAILAVCRGRRRRGVGMVDPATAAAAGFALRVRREGRARACGRSRASSPPPTFCPTEHALVVLARLQRADRAIKAGNYEIAAGITLPQLLDKLTQGDVTQTGLTIVEGSTFAELAARCGRIPPSPRRCSTCPTRSSRARIGLPDPGAEGWFFPDTYFFASGSTDLALLIARRAD